jgi:hypothetical protein
MSDTSTGCGDPSCKDPNCEYGKYDDAAQAEIAALRAQKERKPTFDPSHIRDLSEQVYRLRLEQDCPGNVEKMIAKDEDSGEKLRNRAAAYDPLTRAYLKVLGIEP